MKRRRTIQQNVGIHKDIGVAGVVNSRLQHDILPARWRLFVVGFKVVTWVPDHTGTARHGTRAVSTYVHPLAPSRCYVLLEPRSLLAVHDAPAAQARVDPAVHVLADAQRLAALADAAAAGGAQPVVQVGVAVVHPHVEDARHGALREAGEGEFLERREGSRG